jgi:hypothetical protein
MDGDTPRAECDKTLPNVMNLNGRARDWSYKEVSSLSAIQGGGCEVQAQIDNSIDSGAHRRGHAHGVLLLSSPETIGAVCCRIAVCCCIDEI